jgi:KaiC/GvpD/RAD55 family RecA-like ATPase
MEKLKTKILEIKKNNCLLVRKRVKAKMKMKSLVLMLFATLIFINIMLPFASSQVISSKPVTLFAVYNEALKVYEGKILTSTPKWGETKISNASIGETFTLHPPLGFDLEISGVIFFKAWLKADTTVFGRLSFILSQISPTGEEEEIVKTEQFLALSNKPDEYSAAIAGVKYTIKKGYRIQYKIQFVSYEGKSKTYLLWNSNKNPTYIVLPCINHLKIDLTILDSAGKPKTFFSINETGEQASVLIQANVSDPFAIEDVNSASISIINSKGETLLKDQPLFMKSFGSTIYSAIYEANATFLMDAYRIIFKAIDSSRNVYPIEKMVYVGYSYLTTLIVKDNNNEPLSNATLIIQAIGFQSISELTNHDGEASLVLPSSSIVGAYNLTVYWRNKPVLNEKILINESKVIKLKTHVYSLKVRPIIYGLPLFNAKVSLIENSTPIEVKSSSLLGVAVFDKIPAGTYSLKISFFNYEKTVNISLEKTEEIIVPVEIPILGKIPYFIIIFAAASLTFYIVKRRRKLYPKPFSFINKIVEGGFPEQATVMILGPPGSGKTVLMENLAYESLKKNKKCIYIVNNEFPSKIRENMRSIGLNLKEFEEKGHFIFIDCYSGLAGKKSEEKHFISSPTDLTSLATEISVILNKLNENVDVYMDSPASLLASIKPETIISFIHATGAKVKGEGGKFCFTMSPVISKEALTKIDEASDCIIELQVIEPKQERKLRIRKVKGRKHSFKWFKFSIEPGKGIVFYIKSMKV